MNVFKNPINEKILKKRKFDREKKDLRGDFFRDQTAIIHSMSFRRLKNKTQVFFSPENDHICTRIEHVLHVATISTVICKHLGLDSELAQAIALGHDLGHAPFGHAGETIITKLIKENNKTKNHQEKFYHEIHSLRIVDHIENKGKGLNLTYAVRDGIISHCGEKFEQSIEPASEVKNLEAIKKKDSYPSTWEGCVVRMADKIAYLGRDIEDAIIAHIIFEENIPTKIKNQIGSKNGEIIDYFVKDLISWSQQNKKIGFSDEAYNLMKELKDFNYKKIYNSQILEDYKTKVEQVIKIIFNHLLTLFDNYGWQFDKYENNLIPLNKRFKNYLQRLENFYKEEGTSPINIVVDYIAGMTDEYALKCAKEIVFPEPISFD